MSFPTVTWEFLEARNVEYSERLGTHVRTLTLRDPADVQPQKELQTFHDLVAFNPKSLAVLTEDEASFMVALVLIGRIQMEEMLPRDQLASAMKYTRRPYMLFLNLSLVAMVAAPMLIFGNRDPMTWIISIACVAVILFAEPIIKWRHRKDGFSKYMPRLAPKLRAKFYQAVGLTGNPAAGERYIRKSVLLRTTEFGEKPLDDDARRRARATYEASVPPEYQVPNAI